MGAATETYTKLRGISREEQDALPAGSHGRAAEAQKNGLFDDEIVAVSCRSQGDLIVVTEDEGRTRGHHGGNPGKLRPAFAATAR